MLMTDATRAVKEGDRVAQLVLERVCSSLVIRRLARGGKLADEVRMQIYTPEVVVVEELEESVRGAGGFGSTG